MRLWLIVVGSACVFMLVNYKLPAFRRFLHISAPADLKKVLQSYLIIPDTLPEGKADALYILGGPGRSTYHHIQKALSLYRDQKTDHILIFDSRGWWGYDRLSGRRISVNEWVIKKLTSGGVPAAMIEIVSVKEGFFGTFSEARDVVHYLESKSYRSVICVSSPCHTRRVYNSFMHFTKTSAIQLYTIGSNDPFGFIQMIMELVKVTIYKQLMRLSLL